jgi:hypothetical protein
MRETDYSIAPTAQRPASWGNLLACTFASVKANFKRDAHRENALNDFSVVYAFVLLPVRWIASIHGARIVSRIRKSSIADLNFSGLIMRTVG